MMFIMVIDWLSDWMIDWIDLPWFGLMWLILFDLICLDAQLGTYQPPIPKTYPASAWSYMYIGRWMYKTKRSPTGVIKKFVSLNG